MRILLSLILASLLAACGRSELRIDGFETEVAHFEAAAVETGHSIKITDLVIEVHAQSNGFAAICYQGSGTPKIEVDPKVMVLPQLDREAILFHELGHCILGRKHLEGTVVEDEYRIPTSLMTHKSVHGWTYHVRREYYVKELFSTVLDPNTPPAQLRAEISQ